MAEVDLDIKVNAIVDKRFKEIERNLVKADKEAKKTEKSFGKMALTAGAVAVAIGGIGTALNFVVDQAIVMEDLTTQFIAFTGSADSAAQQLERIAEFSASTPFQLEELAEANRTLLSFGSSADESIEQLGYLGEAAAATGKPIGDLALILGQVQAAEKLTGERFLQFAERGINLIPQLATQMGVAEGEIRGLISAGKVSDEEVTEAFRNMAAEGGKFSDSMERLSKTLSGSLSTAKDNVSLLAADVGKKLTPGLVDLTIAFTDSIKWIRQFTKETKTDKIEAFNGQIEATERTIENLNNQLKAASSGGILFSIFGGDPEKESAEINKQLESAKTQLVELQKLREAARAAPEEGSDEAKALEKKKEENKQLTEEQKKLNAELLKLREQQAANVRNLAAAETEEELLLLEERGEKLGEKIAENEALRLEQQGLFDEAERARVQSQLQEVSAVRDKAEKDASKKAAKRRSEELNLEKINNDAKVKFDQQTYLERAATAQKGLSALASIQSTGSREAFAIGKAASIAQALVSIPATAIEAYKSLAGIPIVGPGLGAAAAAAAVVAGTAQVNRIRSTQFQGMAEGGLVEGGIPGVDSVPILAQQGEVVVPKKKYEDIAINNDMQISLLMDIRSILQNQQTTVAQDIESEEETEPMQVNLVLDGEVLASQILELNRDNKRIA